MMFFCSLFLILLSLAAAETATTCTGEYEVIIIGGGPSGLQAALTLSRALRKTLLIDNKQPRNMNEKHFHNLLSHDGENVMEFRQQAQDKILRQYNETTDFLEQTVESVQGKIGKFLVSTSKGELYSAKRIILAMGVQDVISQFYPKYSTQMYKSIFQCPYCHGYEIRGKSIGIVITNPLLLDYAFMTAQWSKNDVIVFTNGTQAFGKFEYGRLVKAGLKFEILKIVDLIVDSQSKLTGVLLEDGTVVHREYLFHKLNTRLPELISKIGGVKTENGIVGVKQPSLETSEPGIYAVGDVMTPMHQVAMAIGSGFQGAAFVHHDLAVSETKL